MLENIENLYKPNLIEVKYLFELDRIDENRSNGTESNEYCKQHHISLFDRDKHRSRLNQLRKLIKKDGFNPNAACVKIGICEEQPKLRAILDGQHLIVLIGEMIKRGEMSPDYKINYQLIKTDTYKELVSELRSANNSKPMDYRDKSRLDAMNDDNNMRSKDNAFTVLVDKAEAEYYGTINRAIIEFCVIGQHSSDDIYQKQPFEFWEQTLDSFKDLYKKADERLTTDARHRVHSCRYTAAAIADLYKTILRTAVEHLSFDKKKEAIELGFKICCLLNDAMLGLNSKPNKYGSNDIVNTFTLTQDLFKKHLIRLFDTGSISLGKCVRDDNIEFIFNKSLTNWSKSSKKAKPTKLKA